MKRNVLLSTALITLTAIPAISVSFDELETIQQTRIDVYDADDIRIHSMYLGHDDPWFDLNNTSQWSNSGLGSKFRRFECVQPGYYSYPLRLVADDAPGCDGIKATYFVKDTDISGEIGSENEIKSGAHVSVRIDMPEGTLPDVLGYLHMTRPYNYPAAIWRSAVSNTVYTDTDPRLFYADYEWRAEYRVTGDFRRDETVADRWWIDFSMSNEPFTLQFGITNPDSRMLDDAVYAAFQLLYIGYAPYYYDIAPSMNGEPFLMGFAGDMMMQDAIAWPENYVADYTSLEALRHANYKITAYPWLYCITLIERANYLLEMLPQFTAATEQERASARAKMLTLRSHAYWRLLQMYAPRWEDSDNGNAKCAPLLTEYGTLDKPLSSMNEILDRCYTDLREAIGILGNAPGRSDILTPDQNVARGVLARLALLRHDWQEAADQSSQILKNAPLTSNEQMTGGFMTPAGSWIWGASTTGNGGTNCLGYASFACWNAFNGAYANAWKGGSAIGAIDIDLFRSLPDNDIRRRSFMMPENCTEHPVGQGYWHDNSTSADLSISPSVKMCINLKHLLSGNGMGDIAMNASLPLRLGHQLKFAADMTGRLDNPDSPGCEGESYVPFMRTEEFLLTKAEALCMLGKTDEAKDILTELNSLRRGGSYTCPSNKVMEEIQLCRRIELWGEGFSFGDFKRWGKPVRRRSYVAGDNTSGNWPADRAVDVETDASNGWRFVIPIHALKISPLIDVKEMNYTTAYGYEDNQPQQLIGKKPAKVHRTTHKAEPCVTTLLPHGTGSSLR